MDRRKGFDEFKTKKYEGSGWYIPPNLLAYEETFCPKPLPSFLLEGIMKNSRASAGNMFSIKRVEMIPEKGSGQYGMYVALVKRLCSLWPGSTVEIKFTDNRKINSHFTNIYITLKRKKITRIKLYQRDKRLYAKIARLT